MSTERTRRPRAKRNRQYTELVGGLMAPEVKIRFEALAKAEGKSIAELLRTLVDEYIERKDSAA